MSNQSTSNSLFLNIDVLRFRPPCRANRDGPLYYMYHHYDRDANVTAADAYKVAKALEK